MPKKFSNKKEYDEYVDYLYLQKLDILLKRYGFTQQEIPPKALLELKEKAKYLSVTSEFTMNQSVEQVLKTIKCSVNNSKTRNRYLMVTK